MVKEIHITKPLAVGNDFIANGFLVLRFYFLVFSSSLKFKP